MAKSTRSKVKRAHRAKKRDDSVYAAVEAARLERLSAKLQAVCEAPKVEEIETAREEDAAMRDDAPREEQQTAAGSMEPDNGLSQTKKISTHGSRNSRREQWRASKGLNPRPKSRGMNRQGGAAAKQRAGRPHRRR